MELAQAAGGLWRAGTAGRGAIGPRRKSWAGPAPNKGVELTASSVRSYLTPASSSSSRLALGG
jgi:hypothetical protein